MVNIAAFMLVLIATVDAYRSTLPQLFGCKTCLSMVSAGEEDYKLNVQKSEMIFVVPMSTISMDELSGLRKALPSINQASMVKAGKMIEAVDGTAFCGISADLVGTVFIIFVEKESAKAYEGFTKWIRQLSKDMSPGASSQFVIAKKDHIIRFSPLHYS
eukprot:gene3206-6329_t